MQNRDVYKNKIYSELELVQIRFADFKNKGQNLDPSTRVRYNQHVEKIDQQIVATKAKLDALNAAHDDVWEELVDGVEHTWTVLQSTLEDAVKSFKD